VNLSSALDTDCCLIPSAHTHGRNAALACRYWRSCRRAHTCRGTEVPPAQRNRPGKGIAQAAVTSHLHRQTRMRARTHRTHAPKQAKRVQAQAPGAAHTCRQARSRHTTSHERARTHQAASTLGPGRARAQAGLAAPVLHHRCGALLRRRCQGLCGSRATHPSCCPC